MSLKPQSLLIDAHNIINGDRHQEYGPAKDSLRNIATQWNLYLSQKYGFQFEDLKITPEDVCWMMSDLKKVRQMHREKRDNIVDAAGYLGLIEKVQ